MQTVRFTARKVQNILLFKSSATLKTADDKFINNKASNRNIVENIWIYFWSNILEDIKQEVLLFEMAQLWVISLLEGKVGGRCNLWSLEDSVAIYWSFWRMTFTFCVYEWSQNSITEHI